MRKLAGKKPGKDRDIRLASLRTMLALAAIAPRQRRAPTATEDLMRRLVLEEAELSDICIECIEREIPFGEAIGALWSLSR